MSKQSLYYAAMAVVLAGTTYAQVPGQTDQDNDQTAEARANAQLDAEAENQDAQADAEADADTQESADSPVRVPDPPQTPDTDTDAQADTDTGTQAEADTDTGTQAEADTDTRTQTEADAQLDQDQQVQDQNQNQNQRQSDDQTRTDAEGQAQSQTEAQTQTDQQDAQQSDLGLQFDSAADADSGLVISETVQNSPAAQLGLQPGDRIIGFNGRTFTDRQAFITSMQGFDGRQAAPLVFIRDDQLMIRDVDPGILRRGPAVRQQGQEQGQARPYSAARPSFDEPRRQQNRGRVIHDGRQPQYKESQVGAACGVQSRVYGGQTRVHHGGYYGSSRPVYRSGHHSGGRVYRDRGDWKDRREAWEDYQEDLRDAQEDYREELYD